MGTGVIFLPSDLNELVDGHQILFGALKAGNTGVSNEINAINDNYSNWKFWLENWFSDLINGNNKYKTK